MRASTSTVMNPHMKNSVVTTTNATRYVAGLYFVESAIRVANCPGRGLRWNGKASSNKGNMPPKNHNTPAPPLPQMESIENEGSPYRDTPIFLYLLALSTGDRRLPVRFTTQPDTSIWDAFSKFVRPPCSPDGTAWPSSLPALVRKSPSL